MRHDEADHRVGDLAVQLDAQLGDVEAQLLQGADVRAQLAEAHGLRRRAPRARSRSAPRSRACEPPRTRGTTGGAGKSSASHAPGCSRHRSRPPSRHRAGPGAARWRGPRRRWRGRRATSVRSPGHRRAAGSRSCRRARRCPGSSGARWCSRTAGAALDDVDVLVGPLVQGGQQVLRHLEHPEADQRGRGRGRGSTIR